MKHTHTQVSMATSNTTRSLGIATKFLYDVFLSFLLFLTIVILINEINLELLRVIFLLHIADHILVFLVVLILICSFLDMYMYTRVSSTGGKGGSFPP